MSSIVGTPTVSSGVVNGGTLSTPAYPTGTTDGDVCVLAVYDNSGANVMSAPSGWTKRAEWNVGPATFGSESGTVHVFTHTYAAGDAAPSITPVSGYEYVLVAVRGVSGFGGIGSTTADTGTTSINFPSVTVGSLGAMVLAIGGSNHKLATSGRIDCAAPSGWAEAAEGFYSDVAPAAVINLPVYYKTVGASAASGAAVSIKGNAATDATAVSQGIQLWLPESNTAPNAPTLSAPIGGVTLDRTITQRFSATFSDPNAGDTPSEIDVRYRIYPGAGAWTTVTDVTPNQYHDFAGGTFAAGDYEWQARFLDSVGAVGAWSSSAFFTAASPPSAPTITSPTSGGTVSTSTAPITWSYPTQTSYQVRKVADLAGSPDTGTVYYDSGEVVSTIARSASLTFPVNSRFEHLQVRAKYAGLWSTWASVRVQVAFTAPATPSLVTATGSGVITLTIVNPAPSGGQPAVTGNDVYVRTSAGSTVVDRLRPYTSVGTAIARLAPAGAWVDRIPGSTVVYEYLVVAIGANGATSSSAWTA